MGWSSSKQLLPRQIRKAGVDRHVTEAQVLAAAAEVLRRRWGDAHRQSLTPQRFRRGVLTVACVSDMLAAEIRWHEPELIREIRRQAPDAQLQSIRLTL